MGVPSKNSERGTGGNPAQEEGPTCQDRRPYFSLSWFPSSVYSSSGTDRASLSARSSGQPR
jgi:hypothetical protein